MAMFTTPEPHIPDETFRAARKMYNLQHIYLQIGDELENLLQGINLSLLDPTASLKLEVIFRLSLVTAFQYAESLPDPIASEATLKRIDWKYALYLPVRHPGIPAENLSAFRHNLYVSPKGLQEFSRLLIWLAGSGLHPGSVDHMPESNAVLSRVCKITRIYRLSKAMKSGLGALVSCDPNWLRVYALPHWYERYKTGREIQISQADQDALLEEAMALGADISRLLDLIKQQDAADLASMPEIRRLAWLLEQEYTQSEEGLTWKIPGSTNCSCNIRDEVMH